MTVLAIDQGTSATKAIVVSGDGSVLGEATAAVAPVAGPGGAVTQDPDELYESILTAGRGALAACGHPPLAAIGIGNQGETVLAWDRTTGRPAGAAIGWQDRRAATVTARLAGEAERLTELTGLPLDPYFAAPKLAWLREQQAGVADRAGSGGAGARGPGAAGATGATDSRVMTTIDAWVTHRLTGAYVTDIATASRTMLLDLDRGEWSPQAGAAFGIDVGAQPAIVGCAEVVGETDAFGPAVPVAALIVDQQAALYGQGCDEPGDAKCTYGTGAFLLANAGTEPPRSAAGLSSSVAWRLPGEATRYCLDGQLYTVGAAVRWLAALGLIGGPEELDGIALREPEELPLFVPGLAGLGAPEWAPDARGGWLDLALDTGRDELVGAVLWGIAAQVARLAHAIENDTHRPLRSLRVDGGLTRSRRLMQIQADLLGVPVAVASSPDATAHGIAALARIGVGAGPPGDAAAGQAAIVFEPRLDPDRAAAFLARHAAATAATVGLVSGG